MVTADARVITMGSCCKGASSAKYPGEATAGSIVAGGLVRTGLVGKNLGLEEDRVTGKKLCPPGCLKGGRRTMVHAPILFLNKYLHTHTHTGWHH